MATATTYSQPACVQCNAVKRRIDGNGLNIDYVMFAEQSDEVIAEVRGLGHMSSPVTVLRDDSGAIIDHFQGYDPDRLEKFSKVASGELALV